MSLFVEILKFKNNISISNARSKMLDKVNLQSKFLSEIYIGNLQNNGHNI